MKQLSQKQLDLLVITKDDELLLKFPGYKRSFLRIKKREEIIKRTNNVQVPVEAQVEIDKKVKKERAEKKITNSKYQTVLNEVERLKKEKKAILALKEQIGRAHV